MTIYPGADEHTPSRAQYFSWINNTNEGATAEQTLVNLAFFRWLREEYGMQLDIYAWDAGNLDGPADDYGRMDSEKFRRQFPEGWAAIARAAQEIGCRLGLWGGPDGFGNTPEEAQARIELIAGLCRDYQLALLKIDGVCGTLRPQKQEGFVAMMEACRSHSPDLILLNHRLELGIGMPYATTWLWEGAETYIDVHMTNTITAPHNRAQALARGLPPGLSRLTEDHGVCLSSSPDYWEDDLILQAFNRALILAPEIYGNPWLLRDDEYPRLARIFTLHRRYREKLVSGCLLPEEHYGPHAVSRGDAQTRLITLRNLSWEPVTRRICLGAELGLQTEANIQLRLLHPVEQDLGRHPSGSVIGVEIQPFRAALLLATTEPLEGVTLSGTPYEVVREVTGKPVEIDLLGQPGTSRQLVLENALNYSSALLDGVLAPDLLEGKPVRLEFPGRPRHAKPHRHLASLRHCPVPADAEALYEATCFRATNNALEAQCLERSGATRYAPVQAARDAFFAQSFFRQRGVWDGYLFDGRPDTFFSAIERGHDIRPCGCALRIDLQEVQRLDQVRLHGLYLDAEIADAPQLLRAEISPDLSHWTALDLHRTALPDTPVQLAHITQNGGAVTYHAASTLGWSSSVLSATARYIRIRQAPARVSAVMVLNDGKPLNTEHWKANHLFSIYEAAPAIAAWSARILLAEEAPQSKLCVAVNGVHGAEKVVAAIRVNGQPTGAAQRAPVFPAIAWEAPVCRRDGNYTFYFPVDETMHHREVEILLLLREGGHPNLQPEVWITAYPTSDQRLRLTLTPRSAN